MPFFVGSHAAGVFFGISIAFFALGEVQQTLRLRRGSSVSSVIEEIVFRVGFVAGVLLLPACAALVPGADVAGPAVFVIGAVVGWFGALLRWWCFLTLGRSFTTVVRTSGDQPIVDRGPYRMLRHPSYTGLILLVIGVGLMLGNWLSATLPAVVVTAALVYRLLGEERALVAARGDAYRDYAKGRARLIPFVW